ncbi:3'-5' exonuclease domain-containing protein 2 [Bacteroides sp. 214]|uniref:3'-5' exonuclease n=1 Tax=Bacteroides sp. 214 TaxID=2302935 RepID=UPI0013D3D326|nr:3'-5' exonuclease [Bacteroides sp. 214]NDW13240.1 3'-5' exonuclease domain-containing protein 2 [Bacteroides sp. 214]
MVIKKSIQKEDVKDLPRVSFEGNIHVIQTENEVEKAVSFLSTKRVVGIDSETRPSFVKGQTHKVSLLQISTEDVCFLFRLNHVGLSQPLIDFLENKDIIKVGLSLKDDFLMLHKRAEFKQQSCVELQEYVLEFGIKDKSLQKIYALLFGMKISKSQRLTNWETETLSDSQKKYAATDAWACLRIYNLLEELRATGKYEILNDEPLQTTEQ